ncbi:MAG: Uncharacterized protein FD155_2178 [Bacteroidetes bacterium]|nr:MAG: Uncharacterized protein FD155_2178 [Bacteroidota bacterium]
MIKLKARLQCWQPFDEQQIREMNNIFSNVSEQKSMFKLIWLFFKWLLLLQIVFILFVIISAWLPNAGIRKNITKSLPSVIKEGDYPEPMIKKRKHGLDYSMDAFTMNIIFSTDNDNPLKSAILASSRHSDLPDKSKWEQLKFSIENESTEVNLNYPRYWHGGTSLFRIFFLFVDFDGVKSAIYLLTSFLFVILGLLLFQKSTWSETLLFFLGLIFVNLYISQFSMQFSPVLIISLVASILLLNLKTTDFTKSLVVFLVAGAATSFMDLLTTPLLTFGLPALIWIHISTNSELRNRFKKLILLGVFWFGAYTLTWFTKWVITALVTDFPIFSNVFTEVLYVTNAASSNLLTPLIININQLPLVLINIIFLIQLLLLLFFFNPKGVDNAILYIVVAIIPFLWYLIMSDHSVRHYWFTYRTLSISLIGIFLTFNALLDKERLIGWINKLRLLP